MKNYISEAKSLAYALTRAGESIDEIELIDCIIDGLDDSLSDFCKYYYEINPSLSLDLLSHMLLDHEKLQDIPSLSPRCDISHAHSPPTGYSDEHLSASAQSRQSVYQSRQADPSASEVKVDVIRHPDPSAFPQFSPIAYPFSLATSPPSGTKSNIALVSSISMQSARLATDGSLMHFLLYGSHVPTSAAFSCNHGYFRHHAFTVQDDMPTTYSTYATYLSLVGCYYHACYIFVQPLMEVVRVFSNSRSCYSVNSSLTLMFNQVQAQALFPYVSLAGAY